MKNVVDICIAIMLASMAIGITWMIFRINYIAKLCVVVREYERFRFDDESGLFREKRAENDSLRMTISSQQMEIEKLKTDLEVTTMASRDKGNIAEQLLAERDALKKDRDEWREANDCGIKLVREIGAERDALKRMVEEYKTVTAGEVANYDAIIAERDRFRDALERISTYESNPIYSSPNVQNMMKIASDALDGTTPAKKCKKCERYEKTIAWIMTHPDVGNIAKQELTIALKGDAK